MLNNAMDVTEKHFFTKKIGIKFCPWPKEQGSKASHAYPTAESGFRSSHTSRDMREDKIFYEIQGNSALFEGLLSVPIRSSRLQNLSSRP